MDVFIQKMRIKKNRKVLVIEEAWKAIASPMMAEYIKYLYKTARKFWASVGVVTQEIQDIVGSPIVKEAIINNLDTFLLTMAMTALGAETSIDKFKQAGAKPFLLAGGLYVWLVLGGYFLSKALV